MESPLTILIIAIVTVFVALAIAWVPARMILVAVGKSVGAQVREFVRRRRDRRRKPRGTPDRREGPTDTGPDQS